jgi:hypothetical protein
MNRQRPAAESRAPQTVRAVSSEVVEKARVGLIKVDEVAKESVRDREAW